MKKLILATLVVLAFGAQAQTIGSTSSGTGTATNTGNAQQITFTSPPDTASTATYQGGYTVKSAPSMFAPSLAVANDTCMGSRSGAASFIGIGGSAGSTYVDPGCANIRASRDQWNKGNHGASLALDCMNPDVRTALELTGTTCPQDMTQAERVKLYGANAKGPAVVAGAKVIQTPLEAYVSKGGHDTTIMQRLASSN